MIYNLPGAAIRFDADSERKGFHYYNNIFVGKDRLTDGELSAADEFLGNDWWSLTGGFNIDGIKDLNTWAAKTGQEKKDGKVVGMTVDPAFENQGRIMMTNPLELTSFTKYELPAGSPLRTKGLDLGAIFGIETGGKDFNQIAYPVNGIGASF